MTIQYYINKIRQGKLLTYNELNEFCQIIKAIEKKDPIKAIPIEGLYALLRGVFFGAGKRKITDNIRREVEIKDW